MAEEPALPGAARALLRPVARQLLSRLFLGDPQAGTRRVFRHGGSEGLDGFPDLRRSVKAYARLWEERESLGKQDVGVLSEFLDVNDYPRGVRGTLRDAVTYLLVSLLSDSSGWSPAQSNEVFQLDLAALLSARPGAAPRPLDDETAHPLVRIVAALEDLGPGTRAAARRKARSKRTWSAVGASTRRFTEEEDRRRIERDLEELLPGFAGRALVRDGQGAAGRIPGAARALGRPRARPRGRRRRRRAYPDSIGGRRCLAIVRRIAAPDYRLRIMQNDGPAGAPSCVSTRTSPDGVPGLPPGPRGARRLRSQPLRGPSERTRTSRQMANSGNPAARWSVDLPATPDFAPMRPSSCRR